MTLSTRALSIIGIRHAEMRDSKNRIGDASRNASVRKGVRGEHAYMPIHSMYATRVTVNMMMKMEQRGAAYQKHFARSSVSDPEPRIAEHSVYA